jgi:hypothetical protein
MQYVEIDRALAQWSAFVFFLWIVSTTIFFFLLYLTMRYAIRDGLRDAQRSDRRSTVTRDRDRISAPDMRAD